MKNQKITRILTASVLISNIFTSAVFAEQMNIDSEIQGSIKTALSKDDGYYKEKVKPFKDMGNHWSDVSVGKLVNFEVTSGYQDGTFKPNNTITRAEFASMLTNIYKLKNTKGQSFSDTANHWSKDAIAAHLENGIIINGEYGANYQPNKEITRVEMAKMIVRAMELDPASKQGQKTKFSDDAQISSNDKVFIILASDNKIIGGYPDGTFKPSKTATRAEATSMLVSMMQVISADPVVVVPVGPKTVTKAESFPVTSFEEVGLNEYAKSILNANREYGGQPIKDLVKGDMNKFPIQLGNTVITGIEYNKGFDNGDSAIIVHGYATKSNDPRDTPFYSTDGIRLGIITNTGEVISRSGYYLEGERYKTLSNTYKNAVQKGMVEVDKNFSIIIYSEFDKENIKNLTLSEAFYTPFEDALFLDARQMK